jgi:hypothetical protein
MPAAPSLGPPPLPPPASPSLNRLPKQPTFDPPDFVPEASVRIGTVPDWPPPPPEGTSAQWLPDPTGRDGYRYFDGAWWSPWVCTRGGVSVHHL